MTRVSLLDLAPPRASQQAGGGEVLATVRRVEGSRVWVSVSGGEPFPLPAQGGGYVIDAPAWVSLDVQRRPRAVLRPARDARAGETIEVALPTLQPTAEGSPGPSGPAELSDADKQRLADMEAGLAEARSIYLEQAAELDELDATLEKARAQLPIISSSAPSGVAPQGTIWFQRGPVGQIVAVWEQTGAGVSSLWEQRPITAATVAKVTVGELVAGTAVINSAVASKLWTEVLTAARVRANLGVFKDLVAEHINVVSDDQTTGRGMRLTDRGLVLMDDDGATMVDITNQADTVLSVMQRGRRMAGMESDGRVTGQSLSVAGDVIFDSGRSLREDLRDAAGGTISKVHLSQRLSVSARTLQGVLETAFTVDASGDRQVIVDYGVDLGNAPLSSATIGLHFSTGSYASTGNTRRYTRDVRIFPDSRGGGEFSVSLNTSELGVSPGQTVRVLMSLETRDQGVAVEPTSGTFVTTTDGGAAIPTARRVVEPSAPISRAPDRGTVQDVVEFAPIGWQVYRDGVAVSKSGSDVGAENLVQGHIGGATRWTLVLFSTAQITAALSGATVVSAGATLVNRHFYYTSGGTAVLGVYGPPPASLPSSSIGAWGLAQGTWTGRGGAQRISLPSSTWSGWQNGTTHCISLFTTNTSPAYYGTFDPMSTRLFFKRER